MKKNNKPTSLHVYLLSLFYGVSLGTTFVYALLVSWSYEAQTVDKYVTGWSQIKEAPATFVIFSVILSILLSFLVYFILIGQIKKIYRKNKLDAYKMLFDSLPQGVVVCTEKGVIEIENEFFRNTFNKENSSEMRKILPAESFSLIFESADFENTEVELTSNDLTSHYSISKKSISMEDGEGAKFLIRIRDIELEHQKELIISKQEQDIEAASRLASLGDMASGFAHEINNPLSVIAANNIIIKKILEKLQLDESMSKKFLYLTESIDQTIVRITRIINGLRNLAKTKNDGRRELIKLSELIEDITVLAKVKLYSTGVDLFVEVKDCKDLYLNCQKVEITQVIMSLISNSIDATGELPEKWIRIEAFDKDDNIEFRITDSGKGISPEISHKIFQPMFTNKEIGKGMGLGLSISHSIVDRHGGKLSIDTGAEHTCFVMTLPKEQLIEDKKIA